MTITTRMDDKICTLLLEGSIDVLSAPDLSRAVEEAAPSCEKMILDMTKVDYISSSGLRAVVGAEHLLGRENLTLRGLSANVLEIFRLTGFVKYLNIE